MKLIGKHKGLYLDIQLNESESIDAEDYYDAKSKTTKVDKDTKTLKDSELVPPNK